MGHQWVYSYSIQPIIYKAYWPTKSDYKSHVRWQGETSSVVFDWIVNETVTLNLR